MGNINRFGSGGAERMVRKSTVKLLDLIDLDFLQDFQDNFAGSVGVASLTEDEDGNALTRPSCFSELCIKIIRTTECGLRRCRQTEIRGGLGLVCRVALLLIATAS